MLRLSLSQNAVHDYTVPRSGAWPLVPRCSARRRSWRIRASLSRACARGRHFDFPAFRKACGLHTDPLLPVCDFRSAGDRIQPKTSVSDVAGSHRFRRETAYFSVTAQLPALQWSLSKSSAHLPRDAASVSTGGWWALPCDGYEEAEDGAHVCYALKAGSSSTNGVAGLAARRKRPLRRRTETKQPAGRSQ